MDDFFGQVSRALAAGSTEPEAFTLLLRLLSNHFERTDTGVSYTKLHPFGVPNGTPFSDFSRPFERWCRQRRGPSVFWHRELRLFARWFGWQ